MALIVNLFGGPGAGKSTLAYELAGLLKRNGHNAELVVEYAKKVAYKKSTFEFTDQIYLIAKHNHNLKMLVDSGVEIIICDCSFLNTLVYCNTDQTIERQLAIDLYNRYSNIGFIIPRKDTYLQVGRHQTFDQAKALDSVFERELGFLPEKERIDLTKLDLTKWNLTNLVFELIKSETKMYDIQLQLQEMLKA